MALDKTLLQEYADLKVEEKRIKARIDELNPEIKQSIVDAGADKIDMEVGTFLLVIKKKWKYSEKVTTLDNQLKLFKSNEEADGTATFEEDSMLMFKAKK